MFCGLPICTAPWRAGKTTLPHSAKCHWHSLLRPPRLPLSGSDTRKQMITNRTPPPPTPFLSLHTCAPEPDRRLILLPLSRSLSPYMWFYKLWPLVLLLLLLLLFAVSAQIAAFPRFPALAPSLPLVQLYSERGRRRPRPSLGKGGAKEGRKVASPRRFSLVGFCRESLSPPLDRPRSQTP